MSETVLYQNSPPMFRNNPIGFISCVALCAVGVGFLFLVIWYAKCKSEKLIITNEKILYESGILSKARDEVRLTSIRSTRVTQSFFQRILGTGNIEVFTAGDQPEITLLGFPNPNDIRGYCN
jgi:uncharacterized membrane protein YdbT with pleckstrin-like domain